MRLLVVLVLALASVATYRPGLSAESPRTETQYLGFQVFTGSPDPRVPIGGDPVLGAPPSAEELDNFAAEVIARVGSTGDPARRLALVFGPLAFDHSDNEVAALIETAFDIALRRDIAVGFHIDDSMFWGRRRDLLADPANIEKLDWDGPFSTGRRLDWGPQSNRAPPQMCINSAAIEAGVRRRGQAVIGAAVHTGLLSLRNAGRDDLFAGVIIGWETMIGRDFETGGVLGYCALANRGLEPGDTPEVLDEERIEAVQRFITIWASAVNAAGVPLERIYAHVAFSPRTRLVEGGTYAEATNFAPAAVAFGPSRRAGFSTYPTPGLMEEIYDQAAAHDGAPWASAEGANLDPAHAAAPAGMNMETYLARSFNHGAALVNIFGWGVGGVENPFRRAAEAEEAISSYRKFLSGETLVEGELVPTITERLPAKIARIRAELPSWLQRRGGDAEVQQRLEALEAALRVQDFERAEREADAVLALADGQ